MRVANDYRSASSTAYKSFKKKHPNIKIDSKTWKSILYAFSEEFVNEIFETGDKVPLPLGLGYFSILKRKKKPTVMVNGKPRINLAINWQKSRGKGKKIYHMNYHTEGYSFRWIWFGRTARFRTSDYWFFKPSRANSRALAAKLLSNEEQQHIFKEWS